ncbi:MAG TPA: FkbM family methyltransferase [Sphingomicrobium sp.]|nr:FkbM family methyltransferase [Sphingomicrobium sp.]
MSRDEVAASEGVVTFTSYAQNFEDVILWRALQDVENGRYLDIGAQDPVIDSVSLAFYLAGWRGIHVEPVPEFASKLREARPDEMVIQAAVSNSVGPIPLYELGGLSSGVIEIAEGHKRCGLHPREIMVTAVALDRLFETVGGEIHWLKIDVEGMEADVLRSWRRNSARPWVAVIESTMPNSEEPTQDQWIDEILSRGYQEVLFDGLNRYFLHESHPELLDRLNRPANVFDQFLLTPQHFSAAELRADLDETHRRLTEGHAEAEELQAAASEATNACEIANAELKAVSERLLTVEQNHRAAVKSLLQDHERTEERLRSEARENEERLRREGRENEEQLLKGLRNAEGATAAAQIEAARFEERSIQLQEKLDRTEKLLGQAEARLAGLDDQLAIARVSATELENERVQARVDLAKVEERNFQLQDKLNRAEHSSGELVERLAVAQEQLAAAQAEVTQFENGRNQTRVELENTRAAVAAFERQVAEARQCIVAIHESSWGRLGSWLGLLPNGGISPPFGIPSIDGQSTQVAVTPPRQGMEISVSDVQHVTNLLALNGTAFVDALYRNFLRRAPDRAGRNHYIGRLQAGHGKEVVLLAVATSREAQAIGARMEGLSELQKAQRPKWFSRLSRGGTRSINARLNRLEYSFGEVYNAFLERLDRIQNSIDQTHGDIPNRDASEAALATKEVNDASNRMAQSIKSGVSIATPNSAAEFINALRREVQSSSEALLLRTK